MAPLLAATARAIFGNPMPQYLNAITIAGNQAIADTGTTLIFIMEGADMANKCLATAPLTINLPDGKKIQSTHVCDVNILGLPTALVGHIVPLLTIASLIGVRSLCKAGCTVTFDNEKCEVFYKGKVILTGLKDPSTDLWTLPIPSGRMWTTPSSATKTVPNLPRPGPCIGCTPHPTKETSDIHSGINIMSFTHSIQTQANAVKFAHQSLCNPKIFTLLKATRRGFLKGCPNFTKKLIVKYLNPNPATAKGHMKHPCHGIKSTCPKQSRTVVLETLTIQHTPPQPIARIDAPVLPLAHEIPFYPGQANNTLTGPNLIGSDNDESITNIFCFGAFVDKNSGIVYHNLTGLFQFMSYNGSICFFILYHYKSNSILATPISGLNDICIFNAYKKEFGMLVSKGFKP
jgi:hypothetical protein